MFSPLVIALVIVSLQPNPDDKSLNIIASTRLVSFHPRHAKNHVAEYQRSSWYRDINSDGFFQPKIQTIRTIDSELGDYLKHVATNDPDAKKLKNFSSGIRRIRKIRHMYCGQFLGVTNRKNEKLIICFFSRVEDNVDEFHNLKMVPYVDDGNGENFSFYYNLKTKEKSNFHIEGSFGGPFGE